MQDLRTHSIFQGNAGQPSSGNMYFAPVSVPGAAPGFQGMDPGAAQQPNYSGMFQAQQPYGQTAYGGVGPGGQGADGGVGPGGPAGPPTGGFDGVGPSSQPVPTGTGGARYFPRTPAGGAYPGQSPTPRPGTTTSNGSTNVPQHTGGARRNTTTSGPPRGANPTPGAPTGGARRNTVTSGVDVPRYEPPAQRTRPVLLVDPGATWQTAGSGGPVLAHAQGGS